LLNLLFDWFLIGGTSPWGELSPLNLGVNGLVFSTTFVNFFACIFLLLKLDNKLDNFNLSNLLFQNFKIIFIGFISAISSFITFKIIYLPSNFFSLFIKISISSGISLIIFYCLANILKIDDIDNLNKFLKEKFIRL
jgi:putative peptidoglycan lipid II flippase